MGAQIFIGRAIADHAATDSSCAKVGSKVYLPVQRLTARLKIWARRLRRDIRLLARAMSDPRVSWPAWLVIVFALAYAFSPIDLIPDVIPVIGFLDELILLPLAIALARHLIPEAVLTDHSQPADRPREPGLSPVDQRDATRLVWLRRLGMTLVAATWIALAYFAALAVASSLGSGPGAAH